MVEIIRSKARTAAAMAKRERNPNVAAMLRRNARAFYAQAREMEIAA